VFNSDLASGAEDAAKLLGWNPVIHLAPSGDADDAELEGLAMKAISQKPDAISVCGMETSALERVVKRANAEGIPIFVHNQITPVQGDVAAYIGYGEFEAGRTCGDYARELLSENDKKHLPVGQVAILEGAPGEHSKQRTDGFREALKYSEGVQIVEEKSGDWTKDKSDKLVADWLKRYPKLSLIFACNDNMALGAAHAVYTSRLNGSNRAVQIMGFGGTHDALFAVKDGELASTLALEPRKIGAQIVHRMMDTFAGNDAIHPGEVVPTKTTLVTALNLDEFMGGFDRGTQNADVH
jgi:ribose transport system substrate-binding protein